MLVLEERGKLEYQKPLVAENRTNKPSPLIKLHSGIEPRPHWLKASAFTTASTLLPYSCNP